MAGQNRGENDDEQKSFEIFHFVLNLLSKMARTKKKAARKREVLFEMNIFFNI